MSAAAQPELGEIPEAKPKGWANLIPLAKGFDPRRNLTIAGPGRTPDRIRELARTIIHKRRLLTVLGKIAPGELTEEQLYDGVIVSSPTKNSDRVTAVRELAKIAGVEIQRVEGTVTLGIRVIERDELPEPRTESDE
jgi:hypothetical protein